jgi:hypothetical protein
MFRMTLLNKPFLVSIRSPEEQTQKEEVKQHKSAFHRCFEIYTTCHSSSDTTSSDEAEPDLMGGYV